MVSENLKEWVKEKREAGVSDERIKESLEKTGHDPSIVDELDDPFEADKSDSEPSEDLFNSSDESSEEPQETTEENEKSVSDSEEELGKPDFNYSSDAETEGSDSSRSLPSFSLPSAPNISRKKAGAVLVLFIILAGVVAVYSVMSSDGAPNLDIPGETLDSNADSSDDLTRLEQLDNTHSGCPDSGVRVQSVSGSEGVTTADVLVTNNEAWVVLEVKEGDETLSFSTKQMKGESEITVDAVGDQVTLRPLGCDSVYSSKDY